MPMPSFFSIRRGLQAAALGLALLALSGCEFSEQWDREYACQGVERSTLHMQAHPESENYAKVYPMAIDFHIRANFAMVKSQQVPLQQSADKQFAFQVVHPDSRMAGSFNAQTGALSVVEARTLLVDGTPQEARTSGQYHCVAQGAAKT
jgi:hypothetical protein